MTYVCLWTPSWRTGGGVPADGAADAAPSNTTGCTPADLAPALLAVAPRVAAERRGVVWADARSLPARELADRLLLVAAECGVGDVRAGVAGTPVAAEVAARWCDAQATRVTEVWPGGDRDFLALYPVSVLEPPALVNKLLDAVGIETCRDLAALDREAV